MGKTISTMLAAAALSIGVAGPASADDPYAQFYTSSSYTSEARWCNTSWQGGVSGQYGAWGRFIDGCTASVRCPWTSCRVMETTGRLRASTSTSKTCNMTVRIFNSYGTLRYRADYSSSATSTSECYVSRAAPLAYRGESVTVQTNGVIGNHSGGHGQVTSYVWLERTLSSLQRAQQAQRRALASRHTR